MTDPRPTRPLQAALAAFGGMFVLGFTDNLVRLVAVSAGLWQFHAARAGLAIVLLAGLAVIAGIGLRPARPGAVAARSLAMGLAMACYFGSIGLMPIGIAVAGFFSGPIFVMILSVVVLKRPVGVWRWGAALLGFAGLVLVIQPRPGAVEWTMLLPLAGGFFYAVTALLTRERCEGEGTLVLTLGAFVAMFALGAGGLIVLDLVPGLAGEGFLSRPYAPVPADYWGWIGVQALGAIVGVGLLVRAYQVGDATYVAVFEYSLMIFSSLWAFGLWGETLNAPAIAGMGLILLSGVVIALRSRQ